MAVTAAGIAHLTGTQAGVSNTLNPASATSLNFSSADYDCATTLVIIMAQTR